MKSNYKLFAAIIFITSNLFAKEYSHKTLPATQSPENLRENSLHYTPNRGQIVDMKGKLRPDILYKACLPDRQGGGGGVDIYLRNTGVSYVYDNMGEIVHEVEEEVEELIKAGTVTEWDEKRVKDELMQKESIKIHRVDMDFIGSNKNINITNENEVEGYQNFYYAHCPGGITNVHQYNKVTYKNMYDNIDVSYYGDKSQGVKYDIIVKPHADPNQIKIRWTGAEELTINNARLRIKTSVNEFYESIPKVYQIDNGKIIDVNAKYDLNGNTVTFKLGNWNPELSLIIDPWATYFGGSRDDHGMSLDTDASGNVVVTGFTGSSNFPVSVGAIQTSFKGGAAVFAGGDVFVLKMNSTGGLLWSTYYGGSQDDFGTSITFVSGDICVVGSTQSSADFPTGSVAGYSVQQGAYAGGSYNGFVLKFDPTGVRLFGTYYGNMGNNWKCAVSSDGLNMYMCGGSDSPTGIATGGTFQPALNGTQNDAFVVKFNLAGTLVWGTYFGGTKADAANDIIYDPVSTDIYVTGTTTSLNFPVTGGTHQIVYGGGPNGDAFLFRLNNSGNRIWASYYGGTSDDSGFGVNVDLIGNIIITGITTSPNSIAQAGAQQIAFGGGGSDGFIAKFNSLGIRIWGTYLGGVGDELALSLDTDIDNNIYVYGEWEDSPPWNYLASSCAYQSVFGGIEDQFIAKYNPTGIQLCIAYVGGPAEDEIEYCNKAISINGNDIYITGSSTGFYPVSAGAFQTVYKGKHYSYGDAFINKLCINICESNVLGLNFTSDATSVCINAPIKFTPSVANSCDTTGYRFHWVFTGGTPASSEAVKPTITFSGVGAHDVKLIVTTVCKKDSITKSNYITVNNCGCTLAGQFIKGTSSCTGCGCKEWILVTATGGISPYTYLWPDGYDKRYKNQLCPGSYTVNIKDKIGCSVNIKLTAP